jgi:hypothetical protein
MWKSSAIGALLLMLGLAPHAHAQAYTGAAVCYTEYKVAEIDPRTGKTLRMFVVPGERVRVGETCERQSPRTVRRCTS